MVVIDLIIHNYTKYSNQLHEFKTANPGVVGNPIFNVEFYTKLRLQITTDKNLWFICWGLQSGAQTHCLRSLFPAAVTHRSRILSKEPSCFPSLVCKICKHSPSFINFIEIGGLEFTVFQLNVNPNSSQFFTNLLVSWKLRFRDNGTLTTLLKVD